MSKFNFMTPTSTAAPGGFAFGANKPAAPGFGLGASPSGGGLTFGTPATSASSFGSSFGAAASTSFGASSGFGFGAATTSAPATGLNFGSNTVTAPAGGLNFGAPAAGGLNFGAPAQGGLNFGAPAAGGLNFGGQQQPAQGLGGFNFGGATATTSAAASSLSFPFGGGLTNTPATTAQGFGLGTSTSGLFDIQSPPVPFHTPEKHCNLAQIYPAPNFSAKPLPLIGQRMGFDPRVNHAMMNVNRHSLPCFVSTNLNQAHNQILPVENTFDQLNPDPNNQLPAVAYQYSHNSTGNVPLPRVETVHLRSSTPTYRILSPRGKPASTLGGLPDPKPPAAVSLGLGGLDSTAMSGGLPGSNLTGAGISSANTSSSQTGGPDPKSVALPNDLLTVVEAFKTNVRQSKQTSSDIARNSIRPLNKVSGEADSLLRECTELSALLAQRRRTATGLRSRAAASLSAAERAHRAFETPYGVEYESSDAVAWITEVVAEGESTLRLLRRQLEAAQRQLGAPSKPVTDQELALGMRRIHESFVAVAGRLQAVHQLVEAQKAQYLSLRRNVLKDPTDVFSDKSGSVGNANATSLCSDWMVKGSSGGAGLFQLPSAVVADPMMALGLPQNKSRQLSAGPNPFTYLDPPGFSGLPLGFSGKPGAVGSTTATTLGNTSWGMSSNTSGGIGMTNMMGGLQSPLSAGGSLSGLVSNDPIGFALQKPPAGNKRGKH